MYRWTPRPLPVLALLLAVALCGETVAADQGWVPIAAPAPLRPHRTTEAPRFGSRIIKPRLPRQEGVTESTTPKPVSTTPAIKSSTPKPVSSSTRSPRQQPGTDDEEETKSLAQQVADGKYGLIQNELFAKRPSRPGIISYAPNPEVPNDNKDNFGGLRPEEIWLAEDHVLVLSGGPLGAEGHWKPIDNYQAPPRQVKLPPNPSVPPPFPVQLHDGGPTGFVTSNGTNPFLFRQPPPGNFEPGNGIFPSRPPLPFPLHNGSYTPPPQPGLFRQENLTLDDDDPSIFYPPPYDFSFRQDNSTEIPPGPLVPGIVLPPPPSFFAPQNKSASPALFVPDDIYNNVEPPLDELDRPPPPPVRVPRPPRPPARPVLVITTTTPPPAVFISTTPASENEIVVPDYPVKEPNVILHHHGTPVLFISTKNTSSRVVVSPPEKLVVYELPGLPPPPRSGGRTVVSSTPSPASIYYTLPDQAPVKFTIYSATPDPVKQLDYFFATPRPQHYSTVKPKYKEPVYYDNPTTTPQPIYLYPDTTLAPETTTVAPIITTTKAPKKHTTKAPQYLPPFEPSDYDFPTTTPAPVYYNPVPKGRYLPNIQDDYYYEQQGYQQPPRYLPPRPVSRPNDYYYGPPRRPELFYNPRPDPNYFYPAPPPPRRPSPTQAPAYDNYYYQNPQRRPQPRPEVGFYYPPPQRNPPASTTPNPVFNGYFTPQDEKYMDEITKSYFNIFGQRITTPLPPLAATEPIPTSVSLHDDTRVNYRRPLPPINPDSEFIDVRGAGRDPSVVSYQLPGQGQRGPSHYYFLTPRLNSGERLPREGARSPRQGTRTPRDNSANRHPKVTHPLQQKQIVPDNTKKQ